LEQAGYARRTDDPDDRRAVRVEFTPLAGRLSAQLYGPLAAGGAELLATFSLAELAAVRRYLEQGYTLQRDQAKRIREMRAPERRKHK
jgi:DNA-binding MarR family transcriptional regulator